MKKVIFAVMLFVSMAGMASAAGTWAIFGNDIIHQPGQVAMVDSFNGSAKNFTTLDFCKAALVAHRGAVVKYAETDSVGNWINAPAPTKFTRIVNATCQNVQ